MKVRIAFIFWICASAIVCASAAIKVNPHWVNVNTTGVTTVFLTFGGVSGYRPGESVWCGEIMDATPDIGSRPVPGTIFGSLPSRYDLSTSSGEGGFTDIMSIPPSVSRRAYQAAFAGARSTFFYVRHFISATGGPDEYVSVTCELSGGGARSPFALTNVELAFESGDNLLSVKQGGASPPVSASITYTGTGQLHGRWEVVRPGDDPPAEQDLLTEASLPIEQRAGQKRYTELERFSVFLPPTGTYVLRGPDPSKIPTGVSGLHMILLRIETSTDIEAASDLVDAGAGPASVQAGGVAGFPIPPLRYFVGGAPHLRAGAINLLTPDDMAAVTQGQSVDFSWTEIPPGSLYRLVLVDSSNAILLTALLHPGVASYRLPSWFWTRTDSRHISWSVDALNESGEVVSRSESRTLRQQPDGAKQ